MLQILVIMKVQENFLCDPPRSPQNLMEVKGQVTRLPSVCVHDKKVDDVALIGLAALAVSTNAFHHQVVIKVVLITENIAILNVTSILLYLKVIQRRFTNGGRIYLHKSDETKIEKFAIDKSIDCMYYCSLKIRTNVILYSLGMENTK